MRKNILSIGIAVVVLLTHSLLFGTEEKTKTWEEKYKDRPVVYLFEQTSVELKNDSSYVTKAHYKLKIQNQEGQRWGEIPIFYNKASEKIINIQAYTISPQGKRYDYSKIQDFKVYKDYPMYSDIMTKVITMPNVTIGSVIEYEATMIKSRPPIKNSFWYTVYLERDIPVKDLRLSISLPKKMDIKYKEFNLNHKPKIEETSSTIVYSWQLNNVEAKEHESFEPPPDMDNVKDCAEFSSLESWKDISGWYLGLVKKNMIRNSQIEKKVKELIKGKETANDKIRSILKYLQNDFRYVSMSFSEHAFEPHSTTEVFKNTYGDCKDLSLLCTLMLKIAGINSHIALFGREDDITDPQYDLPIPVYFNHVLLEVEDPSGNFYIDPLLDGYDIKEYPLSYQMAYTFIITEDGGRFGRLPLFDEKRNYSKQDTVVNIREDGSALIEAETSLKLDDSIGMRRSWKALSQKEKDEFLDALDITMALGGKVIERRLENMENPYGLIKSYYKFEVPNLYPVTDNMIIFSPPSYGRPPIFTEQKRENPIFFPFNGLSEENTIYRLPKGFFISYLPKDFFLDIGFESYKRNYKKQANGIVVTEIKRLKRMEIPKEKYSQVRDFYNNLSQNSAQKIIAKKNRFSWPWGS